MSAGEKLAILVPIVLFSLSSFWFLDHNFNEEARYFYESSSYYQALSHEVDYNLMLSIHLFTELEQGNSIETFPYQDRVYTSGTGNGALGSTFRDAELTMLIHEYYLMLNDLKLAVEGGGMQGYLNTYNPGGETARLEKMQMRQKWLDESIRSGKKI